MYGLCMVCVGCVWLRAFFTFPARIENQILKNIFEFLCQSDLKKTIHTIHTIHCIVKLTI